MSFRLVQFFRQMAVLTAAGVPLLASLDNCRLGCADHPRLAGALGRLLEHLRGGIRISQAMEATGWPFHSLHWSVVAAGESSGRLVEALTELAEREESEGRVLRRVRSAMTYPAFVVVLASLGLFGLLKFLLPVLVGLSRMNGHPPSASVQALTRLASLVNSPTQLTCLLAVMICVGLLALHLVQRPAIWIRCEQAKLRIPIFRIRSNIMLCHSLSSLLRTGLPLVDTLRLVSSCLGNLALKNRLAEAVEHVRKGESLSTAIRGLELLPRSFQGVVAMGEECGRLEDALSSLARLYEWELELAVERFIKTLEPVTIAGVGSLVLGLMLVTFQPMYEMLHTL